MRSASLIPRGEKRTREKKERCVFEGERRKNVKAFDSSIKKCVHLRHNVYIERTHNTVRLKSYIKQPLGLVIAELLPF